MRVGGAHPSEALMTLAGVAERQVRGFGTLFAVIIDCSPPLRVGLYSNYATILKVVDPGFNYRTRPRCSSPSFTKHVKAYIFTERPEDGPTVRAIGDVIQLKRFCFRIGVRDGDMRGYARRNSAWALFDGGDPENFHPYASSESVARYTALRLHEIGRLADLRYWADHFFFSNYLRFIGWWRGSTFAPGKLSSTTDAFQEDNRDLVLRCTATSADGTRVELEDAKGAAFSLALRGGSGAVPGRILQFKGVNLQWRREGEGWTASIELQETSSCLRLPPFSCDYRLFDRLPPRVAGAAPPRPRQSVDFFQAPSGRSITAFRPGTNLAAIGTISELCRVLVTEPQKHIAQKYVVEGRVAALRPIDAGSPVLRYYPFEKRAERLDEPSLPGKKSRALYNILLELSEEGKGDRLPVYIVTNENEFYLFDGWNVLPSAEDSDGWARVDAKAVSAFERQLARIVGARLRVVVQLMLTVTHKYFFKLADTIFLPLD